MELRSSLQELKVSTAQSWMSPSHEPGLVSVIIPTYNRSGLLLEALDSLARQTYRPIEVIVVDDGSSDDTPEAVERWIAGLVSGDGLRVRYHRQINKGAPSARNRGLIESRGEFIQFLDSDDLLSPRKIELGVAALVEDPEVDLVYGPTELVGADGAAYPGLETDDPQLVLEAVCVKSVWTIMGPLYRRGLCVEAGPWLEELSCWQDREYALRILAAAPELRFVPDAVSYYRLGHGPSIGDNWSRSLRDLRSIRRAVEAAARTIEAGCGLTPRMRESLARHLAHAGRLLGQLGEVEEARAALRSAEALARGSAYARTVSLLRLITRVAGFRLTNRGIALRARLRGRAAGVAA
ncbi:MAG TPA: glycosyltransferase [Longimicrobiaceae bacterium]